MKKNRAWTVQVCVNEGDGTYPFDTYKVMARDDCQARDMAIDLAQKDYAGVEGKPAVISYCNIECNGWIYYDG